MCRTSLNRGAKERRMTLRGEGSPQLTSLDGALAHGDKMLGAVSLRQLLPQALKEQVV
jgi:hypothetical protein